MKSTNWEFSRNYDLQCLLKTEHLQPTSGKNNVCFCFLFIQRKIESYPGLSSLVGDHFFQCTKLKVIDSDDFQKKEDTCHCLIIIYYSGSFEFSG